MQTLKVDYIDWPRCYMCNLVVEKFEIIDTGSSLILTATCHGKEEKVTVDDSMWQTHSVYDFELKEAFREC